MSAQKEYRTVSRNMQWLAIQNNTLSIESAQKKFWRNYPVSQDFLRLVQTANLYVLECLKTVCDENDLHVWLHGGTLIGALRNNGFIPWDDDMDVGMTREDLELLCKILKNSNKYAIEYLYHDDNTFSRAYQFKLKDKQLPNYIDIFVFDKCAVFDGQKGCTAKLSEIRSIRAQLVNAYTKSNNKVTAIDIGYWHFGPLTDKDKQTADTLINSYLAKLGNVYKGNAYYYSIENYPFPYPVILEERMFPLKKIKFEKIEFYIPNDPEYYLDGYGDIWQMPADIGKHPHLYYYEPYAGQIEKFLMKKNYKID
jgi:lipopolysaccharide cholinephosphotransferase